MTPDPASQAVHERLEHAVSSMPAFDVDAGWAALASQLEPAVAPVIPLRRRRPRRVLALAVAAAVFVGGSALAMVRHGGMPSISIAPVTTVPGSGLVGPHIHGAFSGAPPAPDRVGGNGGGGGGGSSQEPSGTGSAGGGSGGSASTGGSGDQGGSGGSGGPNQDAPDDTDHGSGNDGQHDDNGQGNDAQGQDSQGGGGNDGSQGGGNGGNQGGNSGARSGGHGHAGQGNDQAAHGQSSGH